MVAKEFKRQGKATRGYIHSKYEKAHAGEIRYVKSLAQTTGLSIDDEQAFDAWLTCGLDILRLKIHFLHIA